MKTVAVIPVHGRHELVKHTIERLLKKNGCMAVICAGITELERAVCEKSGAIFIEHENLPLSNKWNACFLEAKKLNPDAVLFMGSSDWISDNWITYCSQWIDRADLIGHRGFHLLDIGQQFRVCYWDGYGPGRREKEPIGIGRILSARILDKLEWKPIDEGLNNSIDWSMYQNVLKSGGKVQCLEGQKIKSLSISCDKWPNMHKFEDHWNNVLPSVRNFDHAFLINNFPEAYEIFKNEN